MSTTIDVPSPGLDRRTLLKGAAAAVVSLWQGRALADVPGNFRAIYLDPALRERFFPFLQNVFHLYPDADMHRLITRIATEKRTDEEIYRTLLAELPTIKPRLSEIRYGVPALRIQKDEMTRQALVFIGPRARADGYVEIGTTGRYVSDLRNHATIDGPIWIVNDVEPSYAPADIMERGGLTKFGTYVALGRYDPFAGTPVPEASVDLVTNFIGFHHCPEERLAGFVDSIRRVLRPGGRLLLRDHDVDDADQEHLVGLAHDVYNAGLFLTWADNAKQVRRFRSVPAWSEYLVAAGFTRSEKAIAQEGDPTKNLLVEFRRA